MENLIGKKVKVHSINPSWDGKEAEVVGIRALIGHNRWGIILQDEEGETGTFEKLGVIESIPDPIYFCFDCGSSQPNERRHHCLAQDPLTLSILLVNIQEHKEAILKAFGVKDGK